MKRSLAILVAVQALVPTPVAAEADPATTIWFAQPASNWNEALPVGNGRLGAMIFGGIANERIQLNEESLWAGQPVEAWPEDSPKHLAEVRRLVFAGQNAEAQAYGVKRLTATPTSFRSYEPLGDLWLEFGGAETNAAYRRELLLADGLARVSFRRGDATITREVFVSAPDDVLVVRVTTDQPGTLDFTAFLSGSALPTRRWRNSPPTRASPPSEKAQTIPGWLCCISSSAVICWWAVRAGPRGCRRICRASGTTRCGRRGRPTTT